jgi:uncharacterized protein
MLIAPIPKILHPIKFADQGLSFSGEVALERLPRVMELLTSNSDAENSDKNALPSVRVQLSFSIDEQNFRVINGQLDGQIKVECQRCLAPTIQKVSSEFQLAVVITDEQARHLPKYYEPLLVENDEVDLFVLVEEELLLSMPMFSYHSDKNCAELTNLDFVKQKGDDFIENMLDASKKQNPFEILKNLKK